MNRYLPLAWKLIAKRKTRFAYLMISIGIGIASLFALFAIHFGAKEIMMSKALSSIGLNEIIVEPRYKTGLLKVTKKERKEITKETIKQVEQIRDVVSVHPTVILQIPTSMRVSMFGNVFESDAPIFGVPPERIADDVDPAIFSAGADIVPTVVSKDLINFYNMGFADSLGQPKLNEDLLVENDYTLVVGYSSFLGFENADVVEYPARIVGFSNKVPLIGLSVPLGVVEQYSQDLTDKDAKINSLFVKVTDPSYVDRVSEKIKTLGFATESLQEKIKGVNENIKILTLVLGAISIVILLSVAISIFNTFLSDVLEGTMTIGILRSVGATKTFIQNLFLMKSAIVSFLGGVLGVLIGFLVSISTNTKLLDELPFFLSSNIDVIATPWYLFFVLPFFSILLGLLASLYAARYAAHLNPAEALKR